MIMGNPNECITFSESFGDLGSSLGSVIYIGISIIFYVERFQEGN